MDNYKEKYENLIRQLKKAEEEYGGDTFSSIINKIVPELQESKDEKIRKEIIDFITSSNKYGTNERCGAWLTWLEKQGEQKPVDKAEPKFKVGDIIKYIGEREEFSKEKHTIKEILDDCYLTIDDVYIPFKFENCYILVNQNHIWSEEDEYQINTILHGLDLKRELYKKEGNKVEEERYKTQYDWLKSLKPNRWKPSEEQMKAIKYFIDFHRQQANASTEGWSEFKHLESLYNDLKILI